MKNDAKQEELMENDVDVSDATLNKHTANIQNEFLQTTEKTHETVNMQDYHSSNDNTATELVGEQCIKLTLAMFDIAVDDVLIKDTAKNYAVLFQKYFPNSEMLDKWKEEIACIVSTFALGGAIMLQVKQKKAQKVEEKTFEEQPA